MKIFIVLAVIMATSHGLPRPDVSQLLTIGRSEGYRYPVPEIPTYSTVPPPVEYLPPQRTYIPPQPQQIVYVQPPQTYLPPGQSQSPVSFERSNPGFAPVSQDQLQQLLALGQSQSPLLNLNPGFAPVSQDQLQQLLALGQSQSPFLNLNPGLASFPQNSQIVRLQ